MRSTSLWCGALLLAGALTGLPAREAFGLDRGWYVNLGAGVNHIDVVSGMRTEPDLGYRLVATGGYQINRNWGIELDTGMIQNTYSQSRSASQRDNPLTQTPVVLNGVFSYPNTSPIEPFVGVGGGVMFVTYRGSSGAGDAALSFKGGARYLLHDRLGIGADYTFFMLGATSAIVEEPVGCDTFNLTLHWMF